MTSRDKTSKLDSSEYKKMMAQNVYDANKATLLILKFKGQQIRKYVLNKDKELMIGRLANNNIVIENEAVSGKHAKIFALDDEYCIQDLESTNGTFVNKTSIKTHVLKDEDLIAIGKHELKYFQYETYTLEETLLSYDADILLKGFMVGRTTVLILKTGGGYYLSFQGKIKRLSVNGKTVKGPTKLMDADTIEIGSIKLIFQNP